MDLTLEQLREFCREFDEHHKDHSTESLFEGWFVFLYVEERLSGKGKFKDAADCAARFKNAPRRWPRGQR